MFPQTNTRHTDNIWAYKFADSVLFCEVNMFLITRVVLKIYKWHSNFVPSVMFHYSRIFPAAKNKKLFQTKYLVLCNAFSLTGQRLAMSE